MVMSDFTVISPKGFHGKRCRDCCKFNTDKQGKTKDFSVLQAMGPYIAENGLGVHDRRG